VQRLGKRRQVGPGFQAGRLRDALPLHIADGDDGQDDDREEKSHDGPAKTYPLTLLPGQEHGDDWAADVGQGHQDGGHDSHSTRFCGGRRHRQCQANRPQCGQTERHSAKQIFAVHGFLLSAAWTFGQGCKQCR